MRRLDLLRLIARSPDLRAAETERCRRDVGYFLNQWGMTFDPRRDPHHFPFRLYDYQTEMCAWLDERFTRKEDGLIEKSRDMGVTWVMAGWFAHRWLFHSGFTGKFGSRKEDLVDDWTLDSIFGKLRYLIKRLPVFLQPAGLDERKHMTHLALTHPSESNAIVGESTNQNFGRGGRSSIAALDEFAHVQHSEAVWAAISYNSDCVIALSSPNGKGNQFAWLRHETKIAVLTLHWSRHPRKDKAWYDREKATMDDWQVAQELDISYERSRRGRIYKRFDRSLHVAPQPIMHDKRFEQFVAWDFGGSSPTAIIWGQTVPGLVNGTPDDIVQVWQVYELGGEDIDFFIPIARGRQPTTHLLQTEEVQRQIDRALTKVPQNHGAYHYGDHAGTARTANSKRSCQDALEEAGLILHTSGKQTYDWRIKCLDNLLKVRHNPKTGTWYPRLQISPDCTRLIDCFNNYEYDDEGEDVDSDDRKPKINWASHMMTALEFLAINKYPVEQPNRSREQRIR